MQEVAQPSVRPCSPSGRPKLVLKARDKDNPVPPPGLLDLSSVAPNLSFVQPEGPLTAENNAVKAFMSGNLVVSTIGYPDAL